MVIFVTSYPNISVLMAAYKAGGRRQIPGAPSRALKKTLDELAGRDVGVATSLSPFRFELLAEWNMRRGLNPNKF